MVTVASCCSTVLIPLRRSQSGFCLAGMLWSCRGFVDWCVYMIGWLLWFTSHGCGEKVEIERDEQTEDTHTHQCCHFSVWQVDILWLLSLLTNKRTLFIVCCSVFVSCCYLLIPLLNSYILNRILSHSNNYIYSQSTPSHLVVSLLIRHHYAAASSSPASPASFFTSEAGAAADSSLSPSPDSCCISDVHNVRLSLRSCIMRVESL